MVDKSYICDGKEVRLTGRVAEKTLRSHNIKKLFEVQPIDVEDNDKTYNKWVTMEELFEVLDTVADPYAINDDE